MWDLTLADISSDAFIVVSSLWLGRKEIVSQVLLQTSFFSNWPYWPFMMLAKLTFFLLYIQMFRPMKWLRYSCYAGATFTVLFYAAMLILNLAVTAPGPKQSWQQAIQRPGHNIILWAAPWVAGVGLVLDVFILILPIAGVSRLQLSRKRKFGVIAMFLTGVM